MRRYFSDKVGELRPNFDTDETGYGGTFVFRYESDLYGELTGPSKTKRRQPRHSTRILSRSPRRLLLLCISSYLVESEDRVTSEVTEVGVGNRLSLVDSMRFTLDGFTQVI